MRLIGSKQVVDKYYHCVQCGVLEGFDLCLSCQREGLHTVKHERTFPLHALKLVTKHTAPVIRAPPKPTAAPPAPPALPPPPPKPPAGFNASGATSGAISGAISERVVVPFDAKVRLRVDSLSAQEDATSAQEDAMSAQEDAMSAQEDAMSAQEDAMSAPDCHRVPPLFRCASDGH